MRKLRHKDRSSRTGEDKSSRADKGRSADKDSRPDKGRSADKDKSSRADKGSRPDRSSRADKGSRPERQSRESHTAGLPDAEANTPAEAPPPKQMNPKEAKGPHAGPRTLDLPAYALKAPCALR